MTTRLAILGAAVTLALLPATARADTYCVAAPDCAGTAMDTIQDALDAAKARSGPDTVRIGPGTFTGTPGFSYVDWGASNPLRVIGAGAGSTILRPGPSPDSGVTTLELIDGTAEGSGVSDLTLHATGEGPEWSGTVGLGVTHYTTASTVEIERVAVRTSATARNPLGMHLVNATVDRADIDVRQGDDGSGEALTITQGGRVSDSRLRGRWGISAGFGSITVERTLVDARATALSVQGGNLWVSDSVLRLGTYDGVGVDADARNRDTGVLVEQSTIVAPGCEDVVLPDAGCLEGIGLRAIAGSGHQATMTVRTSIIGARQALRVETTGSNASSAASLFVSRSDFDADARAVVNGAGSEVLSVGQDNLDVVPRFVDVVGGDLHLRHDSPLVDAGAPDTHLPVPATDLDGRARFAGGTSDLGAYEYQRSVPVARATATPETVAIGEELRFDASASADADAGETAALTFAWRFDDDTTATGPQVTHTFATAGRHSATVTVTDPTGQTATASVTVDVVAPVKPRPPDGPPAAPPAGSPQAPASVPESQGSTRATSPPAAALLDRLRLSRTRFTVSARTKVAITFRLSTPAPVRFTFARRVGRRWTPVAGALTQRGRAGANRLTFTGRVKGRALTPGTYRLTASVPGTRTVVTATFRVLAPRR